MAELLLNDRTEAHNLPLSLWTKTCLAQGCQGMIDRWWVTDVPMSTIPSNLDEVLAEVNNGDNHGSFFGKRDDTYVWCMFSDGTCDMRVGASTPAQSHDVLNLFQQFMPERQSNDQQVPFNFWCFTPGQGAVNRNRLIDVPRWSEVADNYPSGTREQISRLMDDTALEGGNIILWYGVPGTGKTYALRSLAWEWREWCNFHYVVDADVMFSAQPSYLVEVAMQGAAMHRGRKNLMVLEDASELITPDARQHVGQALSRLLNLTDGLIGQGLGWYLLITTNEDVGKLHPAVSRVGRAASKVEFESFNVAEANAWLGRAGIAPDGKPATLAELIARKNGHLQSVSNERLVGFAAG